MAANLVSTGVVHEVLTEENYKNYENWSVCIKNYFQAHDLWDTVHKEFKPEKNEVEYEIWKKKNFMALHAIQISCGSQILSDIRQTTSAKVAWDFLADKAKKQSQGDSKSSSGSEDIGKCGSQILSEIRQTTSAKVAWDFLADKAKKQSQGDSKSSSGSEDIGKYVEYVDLLKAVEYDDFDSVKNFLSHSSDAVRKEITVGRKTALHVAVTAGHKEIVKELVQEMTEDDLEIVEVDGYTALSAAAISGIQEMAERIYNKNNRLIGIPTKAGMIPVVLASSKGHEDMVDYLYGVTPRKELIGDNKARGATLISNCIVGKKFDIALHMLWHHRDLAFVRDLDKSSPVFRLSQMPSAFHSKRQLLFWQRLIYSCFQLTQQEIWGQARREIQEPNQGQSGQVNVFKQGFQLTRQEIWGQAHPEIQEPNQGQTGRVNVFKQVLGQLHWLLSSLLKLLGIFESIYKRKLMNVRAVELVRCIAEKTLALSDRELASGLLFEAIFEAVRHGNVEFITEIIRANPDLLWCIDEHKRDIFMYAVLYRQEKIFNLLYGIKARKDLLTSKVDKLRNNMLHLAGMLAPSSQLDHMSGAALQMQRELQWFEEVKSIVNRKCKESLNLDGKKPRDLFTKNHKNMVKEGQEWMKGNATSCSVVAALIVTIMFTVAFTVPGGDSDETGLPIFLKTTLFKVFLVCDAISFFTSAASAMIFLGILTSRYAEDDFLESLPRKMIFGQTALFFSFVTMMAAFCTALILMLQGQSLWPPILIIVFASVPILLFLISQFPLLLEIIHSTYGPSIFNRNTKHWLTK